ncbi:hypothetical protein Tsubulata_043683 [Turnera subulata]|uniref:PUM-HD domain-containing protein n=1 Tax=Turnera subulata TaxID=218843 RepID=A0A9Q0FJR7_9ROSI|nr:hypothetical protein Tsubulata_043683 [Turnera subulata]
MAESIPDSNSDPTLGSTTSPSNSSMENLSLSVQNLSLTTQSTVSDQGSASSDSNILALPRTLYDHQEPEHPWLWNSVPAPVPSGIWVGESAGSVSVANSSRPQDVLMCLQKNLETYLGSLSRVDFINLATNAEGSWKLQNMLKKRCKEITSEVFNRVMDASSGGILLLFILMIDRYGAHVIDKLLEQCSYQQLVLIADRITLNQHLFVTLSCDRFASNSIKKLIQAVKTSPPLVSMVINCLCVGFYEVMADKIGNHVVFHCLNHLDVRANAPLYEAAIKHCLDLAVHWQGCITLNNLIERIQDSYRQRLLEVISNNAAFLSQDPKGNFVIQKVLDLKNPALTLKIASLLRGHYAALSLQKGGSHVVEKCLNSMWMELVVEDLVGNTNRLVQIAKDRYGNFVFQTALNVTKQANSPLYKMLLEPLLANPSALRTGYGRNIMKSIVGQNSANEGHHIM